MNRQLVEKRLNVEKVAQPTDVTIIHTFGGKQRQAIETSANAHECRHLSVLLNGLAVHITVYADKGYDSQAHLSQRALKNGIMQKAQRGRPLSREQKIRNGRLAKVRHVEEQNFDTLCRKFRYAQTTYFGLNKARAQSHLKAMCVNLLKVPNWLSVPVAA